MDKCSIPKCRKEADGPSLYQGFGVCDFHERKHQKSNNIFIWKQLKIDRKTGNKIIKKRKIKKRMKKESKKNDNVSTEM